MKYVAIAGAVVVVILLVLYIGMSPAEDTEVSTAETAVVSDERATPEAAREQGFGTIGAFLGRGESGHCTFTGQYDTDVSGEGELWFDGERIRVESITRVEGEVYTSNLINDGELVYVWGGTAAGTQAMVMDAESSFMEESDEQFSAGQAEARVDLEQEVSYSCQDWAATAVQFVPPQDIEFMDMQALMEGMFQGDMRGLPEGMDLPI